MKQVKNEIEYQASNVWYPVSKQVRNEVWDQVRDQIKHFVRDQIMYKVRNQICFQIIEEEFNETS